MTRKMPVACATIQAQEGFSLLEALVSLIIASLVVGGVSAVYSAHADSKKRLQIKEQEFAVLESAMQGLISGTIPLKQGNLNVEALRGAPMVSVAYTTVRSSDKLALAKVTLRYGGSALQTSLLIPDTQ